MFRFFLEINKISSTGDVSGNHFESVTADSYGVYIGYCIGARNLTILHKVNLTKEGSRMEGTLDFDSYDLEGSF